MLPHTQYAYAMTPYTVLLCITTANTTYWITCELVCACMHVCVCARLSPAAQRTATFNWQVSVCVHACMCVCICHLQLKGLTLGLGLEAVQQSCSCSHVL